MRSLPCLISVAALLLASHHTFASETATATLWPAADAYVRDGSYAATNFGSSTSLAVKTSSSAGTNRITYVRFGMAGPGTTIVRATLLLFGSRSSATSMTDVIYEVGSNSWSETAVTWNNRPTLGNPTGSGVQVGPSAQWWTWDVTEYVRRRRAAAATHLSLALKMDSPTSIGPDTFNSREAAVNQPMIIVEFTINDGVNPGFERPASASPSTVFGKTTQLSVLGSDDGGEAALTYTWWVQADAPGPVSFYPNETNAAKNTTATFTAPGTYDVRVWVRDADNNMGSSTVRVTVESTLASIRISPSTQAVDPNGTCAFVARGFDQFGSDMGSVDDPYLPDPVFWSVSGGGTMEGGLFRAGPAPGGPFTVTATKDGVSGTATVRVATSFTKTLSPGADAYVRDGASASTNYGTATVLNVKHTAQAGNKRISYLKFPLTGVAPDVTRATLRIYGSRANALPQTTTGVRDGLSNSWTETGITWNNKPATGYFAVGHSQTIGVTPQWYEFNVTDYIRQQRAAGITTVTLSLEMFNEITDGPDTFNSREAASNRPQLVVISR